IVNGGAGHRITAAKHTNSPPTARSGLFRRRLSVGPVFEEGCLHAHRYSGQKARISGPEPAPPKLPGRSPVRAIPGICVADRTPPTSGAKTFPTWMQNVLPNPVPNHPT